MLMPTDSWSFGACPAVAPTSLSFMPTSWEPLLSPAYNTNTTQFAVDYSYVDSDSYIGATKTLTAIPEPQATVCPPMFPYIREFVDDGAGNFYCYKTEGHSSNVCLNTGSTSPAPPKAAGGAGAWGPTGPKKD